MRPFTVALLCLALGAPACRTTYDHQGPVGTRNMWAADEIRDSSMREAVLAQHTLYPYHFEVEAAQLNSLGWRDIEILSRHFGTHGGSLSVRRGGASDELYRQRLAAVEVALTGSGVEPGRVRLSDSAPGGQGTTSERMLEVLEKASQELSSGGDSTRSGSSQSSTGPATNSTGGNR
jgi:hypothetical protein